MPPSVKAGDRVLLPGWGGNTIKVGEEVCTNRITGNFVLNGCFRNISYSRTQKFWPRSKSRRTVTMTYLPSHGIPSELEGRWRA